MKLNKSKKNERSYVGFLWELTDVEKNNDYDYN